MNYQHQPHYQKSMQTHKNYEIYHSHYQQTSNDTNSQSNYHRHHYDYGYQRNQYWKEEDEYREDYRWKERTDFEQPYQKFNKNGDGARKQQYYHKNQKNPQQYNKKNWKTKSNKVKESKKSQTHLNHDQENDHAGIEKMKSSANNSQNVLNSSNTEPFRENVNNESLNQKLSKEHSQCSQTQSSSNGKETDTSLIQKNILMQYQPPLETIPSVSSGTQTPTISTDGYKSASATSLKSVSDQYQSSSQKTLTQSCKSMQNFIIPPISPLNPISTQPQEHIQIPYKINNAFPYEFQQQSQNRKFYQDIQQNKIPSINKNTFYDQSPIIHDQIESTPEQRQQKGLQIIQNEDKPDQLRPSMFTTPKPESQQSRVFQTQVNSSINQSQPKTEYVCNHHMTAQCLKTCVTWSLAMKYNIEPALKMKHHSVAYQENGSIQSGPLNFTNDIIDSYIEKESANIFAQSPELLKLRFLFQNQRKKTDLVLNDKSPKLSDFNFIMKQPQSKNEPNNPSISLPLKNFDLGSKCEDILETKLSELMCCVEFDFSSIPLPQFAFETIDPQLLQNNPQLQQVYLSPRVVNQCLVDNVFHYYINGECHGHRVFQQDLHFLLQGKKIVKSIQERVLEYKNLIQSQIFKKLKQLTHCDNNCQKMNSYDPYTNMQYLYCPQHPNPAKLVNNFRHNMNQLVELNQYGHGPYLERVDTLTCKMLNISKSIGCEFSFQNLSSIESFLTNFNQLVMQNGIINKMMFCFDIPISKFNNDITGIVKSYNPLDWQSFTPPQQAISLSLQLNQQNNIEQQQKQNEAKQVNNSGVKPLNLLNEFQQIKQSTALVNSLAIMQSARKQNYHSKIKYFVNKN